MSPLVFKLPFVQEKLDQFAKSLISQNDDRFFRNYIALLKNGEVNKAYSMLSPEVRQKTAISFLKLESSYFTKIAGQMKIVGSQINSLSSADFNETDYAVTYETISNDLNYPYALISISARNKGSGIEIFGVNMREEKQSIEEQSKFNFSTQGVYFIIAFLLPLFIIYTAYRYIIKARKPHWGMFLSILFLSVYLNITSNSFGLTLGVYSFMSKSGLYGPWMFTTPIPLGSIYYYFLRKKYE